RGCRPVLEGRETSASRRLAPLPLLISGQAGFRSAAASCWRRTGAWSLRQHLASFGSKSILAVASGCRLWFSCFLGSQPTRPNSKPAMAKAIKQAFFIGVLLWLENGAITHIQGKCKSGKEARRSALQRQRCSHG